MKRLAAILEFIFGCHHGPLSRVFTIGGRTYKVCCDCGKKFSYSLVNMRIERPISPLLIKGFSLRGFSLRGFSLRKSRSFSLIVLAAVLSAGIVRVAPTVAAAQVAGSTPGVAVGPQYDTTHVYVAAEDFDRFVVSLWFRDAGSLSVRGGAHGLPRHRHGCGDRCRSRQRRGCHRLSFQGSDRPGCHHPMARRLEYSALLAYHPVLAQTASDHSRKSRLCLGRPRGCVCG